MSAKKQESRVGTVIVCAIVGAILWFALGDGPEGMSWSERFSCGAQHHDEYSFLEWAQMNRDGVSPCQP